MNLTLELANFTQLSSDTKHFNAVYHILEYFWETLVQLPVRSLFPNAVDTSGCKVLPSKDLFVGTQQKDRMMKSNN